MSEKFIKSLRELDQHLGEHRLSAQKDQEIRQALSAPTTTPVWQFSPWMATLACLTLFLSVGVFQYFSTPPHTQRHLGGFLIVRGAASLAFQGAVRCQSTKCRLQFVERRTRLHLHKRTQVRRRDQHLQLLKGSAFFDVSPRTPSEAPLRVYVSHGYIEVIGTQFTVWQRDNGGHLQLHEGSIRFFQYDGLARLVKPGEKLSWPLKPKSHSPHTRTLPKHHPLPTTQPKHHAVPQKRRATTRQTPPKKSQHRPLHKLTPPFNRTTAPPPQHVAPTQQKLPVPALHQYARPDDDVPTPAPVPPPVRLDAASKKVVQKAAQLRLQQKYTQAIALLKQHIAQLDADKLPIREVLHYEIGLYLTDYLKQTQRACLHWKKHRRLFHPSQRYKQEIDDYLQRLHCKTP